MINGTDDPKDLGSKKINNQEKQSSRNEGFSGENLPGNYNPKEGKLKAEFEKDRDGNTEVQKRARDVDENNAPALSGNASGRGTKNEEEDKKTAENRDFNSDTEKNRYPSSHPDNKIQRGNINPGK